ncbi:MAG: FAD-binding protein, partial [Nitrososphaerota archaeon]|nr:FAD-binding protein [Nitrososphaerota archaeon]
MKTKFVDSDVLIIGGGMAGCGAAYEARYWGRNLKIVIAEKGQIERSGAVAMGLSAINCYMGMRWNENTPEDFVKYVRNDLMGLIREDLVFDIARHVDSTVHLFEEWGLPIVYDEQTKRYKREGRWQILIHGESYKPIVAEAATKAATEVYNRVMITHLLADAEDNNKIA